MKQILQDLGSGETILAEIPCPVLMSNQHLIASRCSLISAGTERMLMEFGKANYIQKARQQPEKVKHVLDKIKTDGLLPTIEAVRSKLDQPIPLGYCNAGVVLESSVEGFQAGDRVVSNGPHAEVVRVAKTLTARIPDNVTDEEAAFTVLASIGLQGIRLVNPTLGERVVVIGLGLVGLLSVQMLKANGCAVLGIDFDSARCRLAEKFGAESVDLSKGEDPIVSADAFSRGWGVDAVLIATATKSDLVMQQAAEMSRKKGRIVLVGITGLKLRRDDFFKKELTFQVSSSYGPGRYDPDYEEKGQDYPFGYVRWTEQRNFEAVLEMMARGQLDVAPLITHRFSIDDGLRAYQVFEAEPSLGIIINYPELSDTYLKQPFVKFVSGGESTVNEARIKPQYTPGLGFIGAGNYASRTLIPAFKRTGAVLHTLASSGGYSGVHHGQKSGFKETTTDLEMIWHQQDIAAVVIATRHNDHAQMVIDGLTAGKHVFVEKPLALDMEEIERIDEAYHSCRERAGSRYLMVGFNRRFAPHIIKMKTLLAAKVSPKSLIMTVNAGAIPDDHWVHDPKVGGGRIIGEACHFIDLMRYLVGNPIQDYKVSRLAEARNGPCSDKVTITLTFEDGSLGTIHYLANGAKSFPKERIEVFCDNGVLVLDNFQNLKGYDWPGFKRMKLWRQDKGQGAATHAFIRAIETGGPSPIAYEEIMEVSKATIQIANVLRTE